MSLDAFLNADSIDMEQLAREMPELIRYETEKNQKNGYQDIQLIFAKAAREIREKPLCDEQEKVAWYLTALAECAPLIDKEVFDHYKNLELQYKDVLHEVAGQLGQFRPEWRDMIRASIRKACDSRMILREKYISLTKENDHECADHL